MYGRGTCDMKGFIATALAMAPRFSLLNLRKPIHFAFTYDEEIGCLGAQSLVKCLSSLDFWPSLAIVGEPTEMKVIEGHKGCYAYTTTIKGAAGHASQPETAVNAVNFGVLYINRLSELQENLKTRASDHNRYDPPWSTINIGSFSSGTAYNVVPAIAEIKWEIRPVQKSDADFVESTLNNYCEHTLIPEMQAIYENSGIRTEAIARVDGLEIRKNDARRLIADITRVQDTGIAPFCTEAGFFQSLGLDVVVCGPGSIAQAHKPDEFLDLGQLAQCLEMLNKLGSWLSNEISN